ncbi:phosphoserine phosphatase SerB [Cellulomonas flavigena DSM 20109]|uniref:phosphoserine phosphatase n=1 Tax=Cellulomonas flavigena (strain ATCC 482 / DSM 20109 / BCRC 11376 / JCM 18109 / NBRC 3775 / NCIMB 8073 / NRS 134) TaxID=446466 RepID=D5UEC6_CELFN|nr:phosphoserine phosphatase SerB [Cellulomonas flavigena]ADG74586.1 phosphoserine phosphatase SerB [Cellulomonas flavigena DSM 20109]
MHNGTAATRLVVMDVDSTFITGEVVEMLAAHAGSEALVTGITERAMRGEIDFAQSLHERVATLAGLPVAVFDDVLAEVELTPGAAELVTELQDRGWPVGLVSGGFVEVARPLAARLGITRVHANRLEVRDGRLTGRVDGPVVDRAAKAATLAAWAAELGLPMERTIAIGDGANDLDMLAAAATGIAFNAKPVVAQAADHAVAGRLDAVLALAPFAA